MSEITKTDADRLLEEYGSTLEKISAEIKASITLNPLRTRAHRDDKYFIDILLMALRAISEGQKTIKFVENKDVFLTQLDIKNKTPNQIIRSMCRAVNGNCQNYFKEIGNEYLSEQSENKRKAGLFHFYLCNPEKINVTGQLDSLELPNNYFDDDRSSKDENTQLASTNTTISASLFWQFVEFIEENKIIIAATALLILAIAGLVVLTIGTGGLGLLGASAATAIGYIGITGGAAIATTAVGAGAAAASITGLVGLGIFSYAKNREDNNADRPEIDNNRFTRG